MFVDDFLIGSKKTFLSNFHESASNLEKVSWINLLELHLPDSFITN